MRIELGEIQADINLYPGIKQSVVIAKDIHSDNSTRKCLVGYFVSNDCINEKYIKQYLQKKLPHYMIPHRLFRIEKIPTNFNGKLDIKNLPEIELVGNLNEYVGSENKLQQKLCQIWSKILEIPASVIGIEDEFFSLGGDSIMTLKMKFMISEEFSIDTNPESFQYKTIKEIANLIESNKNRMQKKVIPRSEKLTGLLSLAQERLFVIDQLEYSAHVYNILMCYKLAQNTSDEIFQKSLLRVIHNQDILRTMFVNENRDIIQKVVDFDKAESMLKIEQISVRNQEHLNEEMIFASKHVFNLQEELPIRVCFYYENGLLTYSSIIVHHICFDDWSRGVFEIELTAHYDALKRNGLYIPKNHITYREYAEWERNEINEEKFSEIIDYWQNKLRTSNQLNLPTDFIRPSRFDYTQGEEIRFELGESTTKLLKEISKDLKVSLHR